MHKHAHRGHYSFIFPRPTTRYNISRHNGIQYNQTSVKTIGLDYLRGEELGSEFEIRGNKEASLPIPSPSPCITTTLDIPPSFSRDRCPHRGMRYLFHRRRCCSTLQSSGCFDTRPRAASVRLFADLRQCEIFARDVRSQTRPQGSRWEIYRRVERPWALS